MEEETPPASATSTLKENLWGVCSYASLNGIVLRPRPVMPLSYERRRVLDESKIIACGLHVTGRCTAVVLDASHEPIHGCGSCTGVAAHAACFRPRHKGSTQGRHAFESLARVRRHHEL